MSKQKNKDDLKTKHARLEQQLAEEEQPETAPPTAETEAEELPEATLEERIAALQSEIMEWKDKYLRAMAEFDNYRRRTNEEKADWIKRASEHLALNICDVWDNFDRALLHVSEEQKEDKFIKGIFLIEQQLKSALEKEGVRRIEAVGKDFDPKFHEALANIPSEYEEGKVAAIIQNGYLMHDKLIRPVRVAVSDGGKSFNHEEHEE